MIIITMLEIVAGSLRKTQVVTYSSGKKVKRLFNKVTDVVPADVQDVEPASPKQQEMHNQEYLQYAHHMGL